MISLLIMASAFAGQVSVIDFQDSTTLSQVEETLTHFNASNISLASDTSEDERIYIAEIDPQLHYLIRRNPTVEVIEPIMYFSIPEGLDGGLSVTDGGLSTGSDPLLEKQWHMKFNSFDWVRSQTKMGKGTIVAILDTGFSITKDFDTTHVDFVNAKSFTGERLDDLHGHGSHCASTVAQWTGNGFAAAGLAPETMILPIKVLSNSGSGSSAGIAAGIDYASDVIVQAGKPGVISMSLGSHMESRVISNAIDRAIAKGVVVVAASGNSGGPDDHWPASHPPVISVGSVGPDGARAPYSSYGSQLDIMSTGGNKQIRGGGVFQWINFQGTESLQEWQGTSMATPHAAAAVAILLGEGACPNATGRQTCIEKVLKSTAKPGKDKKQYAAGTIDVQKAVQSIKKEAATTVPSTVLETQETLPFPSASGRLAFVISGLSFLSFMLLARIYSFKASFLTVSSVAAMAASGPLYILTYTPLHLPGLSVFMVPWFEIPDYLFGPGTSRYPFWLSALPLVVPFLVCAPFSKARAVLTGILVSSTVYLMIDASTNFNPVLWLHPFGSSVWLGVNALCTMAMLFVTTEWQARHEAQQEA